MLSDHASNVFLCHSFAYSLVHILYVACAMIVSNETPFSMLHRHFKISQDYLVQKNLDVDKDLHNMQLEEGRDGVRSC